MERYKFYWGFTDDERFYMNIDADKKTVADIVDEVHKLVGTKEFEGFSDQEILEHLLDEKNINYDVLDLSNCEMILF